MDRAGRNVHELVSQAPVLRFVDTFKRQVSSARKIEVLPEPGAPVMMKRLMDDSAQLFLRLAPVLSR